jgi:hypothetical protein
VTGIDADTRPIVPAGTTGEQAGEPRALALAPSQWRIALEVEPGQRDLPPIELEDGDAISIPARPSFVSVFGTVTAENAFMHQSGSTVRDYIDRAGPTREADLDAALLVRANGTIVGNPAQRSWWGSGTAGS